MAANDLRVQRRRQEDLATAIADRQTGPDLGAPVLCGKIATAGSFPSTAQAVYQIELYLVGGPFQEGGTPTFTDLQCTETAANLGTAIPPLGVYVRIDKAPGGRYVFSYNG